MATFMLLIFLVSSSSTIWLSCANLIIVVLIFLYIPHIRNYLPNLIIVFKVFIQFNSTLFYFILYSALLYSSILFYSPLLFIECCSLFTGRTHHRLNQIIIEQKIVLEQFFKITTFFKKKKSFYLF